MCVYIMPHLSWLMNQKTYLGWWNTDLRTKRDLLKKCKLDLECFLREIAFQPTQTLCQQKSEYTNIIEAQ